MAEDTIHNPMLDINFTPKTKEEAETIVAIAHRLKSELAAIGTRPSDLGSEIKLMDTILNVSACHCNGTPLKLEELLRADAGDFLHDVLGIRRHMDRDTGKLLNCFLPRYAELTPHFEPGTSARDRSQRPA